MTREKKFRYWQQILYLKKGNTMKIAYFDETASTVK